MLSYAALSLLSCAQLADHRVAMTDLYATYAPVQGIVVSLGGARPDMDAIVFQVVGTDALLASCKDI